MWYIGFVLESTDKAHINWTLDLYCALKSFLNEANGMVTHAIRNAFSMTQTHSPHLSGEGEVTR